MFVAGAAANRGRNLCRSPGAERAATLAFMPRCAIPERKLTRRGSGSALDDSRGAQ